MSVVAVLDRSPVAELRVLRDRARELIGAIDPGLVSTAEATALVVELVELEKTAAAGKTLLAARAAEGDRWKRAGDKSPQHWLARKAGTSLAAAERTLTTSGRLGALDATREALVDGQLSGDQSAAVAGGAAADPRSEHELLRHAAVDPLHQLRERAEARKAAADRDPEATRARIHATRHAKRSKCADGAERIEIRDNPDVIADIWFRASQYCDSVFDQARLDGIRDSHANYMADAFAALAAAADPTRPTTRDGSTPQPQPATARKPLFVLMADLAAVVRGHLEPGETCEIPGFGPYPVDAARRLLHSGAVVHLVLTHGTDPRTVVTHSRNIATAVRAALWPRDRRCVVPGCGRAAGLEIHHTASGTGYHDTGETRLDHLGLLCDHHHDEVTYRGARLAGNHTAGWRYTPPPPQNHDKPNPYRRRRHPPSRP